MKLNLKTFALVAAVGLLLGAAGNQFVVNQYSILIKSPATGLQTILLDSTNGDLTASGTVSAAHLTGEGSGITGLPAGGIAMTVSNNVVASGLVAVDATKTNVIPATTAHINATLATSTPLEVPELYTGSFKLYRGAITPLDAGTQLDFGLTNRYWSLSLTGNLTVTTANLVAGKHANLMITGVATNAAYTWPENWIFIGYKPTYLTANKHADLYLKSTGTTDAGVWAFYGEEQ